MPLYFTSRASLGRAAAEQPREKRKNLFGLVQPTQKAILKGCGGRAGGERVHARHYFLLLTPRPHCEPAPRPSIPSLRLIPLGDSSGDSQGRPARGSGHAGLQSRGSPGPAGELKIRDRARQGCTEIRGGQPRKRHPQPGKCCTVFGAVAAGKCGEFVFLDNI